MSTDGASFQIDVGVQADGAVSAAEALDRLTQQLTSAGAASEAAAAAVRDSETAYRQAETSADRAAKAVERIGVAVDAQKGKLQEATDAGDTSSIDKASAKLAALTQRQSEATAKASAARAALNEQAAALDKLKASAAQAETAEEQLAKTQEAAEKAAEAAGAAEEAAEGTGSSRKIAAGLGSLGGPLGALGQKAFGAKEAMEKLTEGLGDAGPYVIAAVAAVALVAGIAAITAAAVAGIVQIGIWAVGLADAARTNRLLSDGIAKSVAGGAALDKKLTDLSNRVPQTREELASMAEQLAKSGLSGKALEDTLEKNAIAAAKLKFGPDFANEMNSLDQQSKRLKTGISGIFGGLNIEKLLSQLSSLTDLFSETSESGQAIKTVFESIFQPLIDGATGMIPKIRAAFFQFEILVLKALIAMKPWTSKIELAAEIIGVLALVIGAALAIAIGVIVVGIGLMVVAIGFAVAIIVALIAGIVWLAVKIGELTAGAIEWLIAGFGKIKDFLASFSLVQFGADMIQGLINGILGAAGGVLSAVKNTVMSAVDGAKKALGIASPSKVMEAEIGVQMGAGAARGVDKSAGDVQDSLEAMVTPPSVPTNPLEGISGSKGGGAAKGGGKSADLSGATFNFYGVEGAEDAEQRFGDLLTRITEGDLAQLGGDVPAT